MRLTSLPLQLLVFVVLPLLALLIVVAFGGVALHQDEMRQMLVDHNRRSVTGAAENLSEQLAHRQQVLAEVAAGDRTALAERLQDLTPLFDGGLAAFEDGAVRASTAPNADWEALAGRLAAQGAPPYLALVAPASGAAEIAIGAAGPGADGQIVGIVSLDSLAAAALLESLHASHSTDLYLLAADGAVVYGSRAGEPGRASEELAARARASGGTQARDGRDAAGQEAILTAAPVEAPGWALIHQEHWQETLSPLMRYSQAAPLTLVPAVLIALGAVWFGIQRIVVPLRRLEAQAAELSWGDYRAVTSEVGGIEEIRRLQATLRLMAARLEAAQASMHQYIGAITQAQEEERRRLARELHDQTAQALVALDHRQQMLKPYLKDDPAAAALLAEVRAMIAAAIDELRRTVRALRPIYLEDLGLVPALQMLARDLGDDGQIATHFEKRGEPVRLPPEREMALYRIAQEALNNARHHSGAAHLWLTVEFAADQVSVTVRDDGRGFRPPRHASELAEGESAHFGLMGMYERAALIGAVLEIQSEPGTGTRVTVRVPVAPDRGAAAAAASPRTTS